MSRHRDAFEEFKRIVEEELGDSLEKLFLYGSVAKGESRENSDIDILAVVDKEEDKEKLRDIAFETGIKHEVSFSPIVKTRNEYKQIKNSSYGREVRSTGEIHV